MPQFGFFVSRVKWYKSRLLALQGVVNGPQYGDLQVWSQVGRNSFQLSTYQRQKRVLQLRIPKIFGQYNKAIYNQLDYAKTYIKSSAKCSNPLSNCCRSLGGITRDIFANFLRAFELLQTHSGGASTNRSEVSKRLRVVDRAAELGVFAVELSAGEGMLYEELISKDEQSLGSNSIS